MTDIVVGGLVIFVAIAILSKYPSKPKKVDDKEYYDLNKDYPKHDPNNN